MGINAGLSKSLVMGVQERVRIVTLQNFPHFSEKVFADYYLFIFLL
jgi:hypothetical protein